MTRDPLREPKFGDVFAWGNPAEPHQVALYLRRAKTKRGWIGLHLNVNDPTVNDDAGQWLPLDYVSDGAGDPEYRWTVVEAVE